MLLQLAEIKIFFFKYTFLLIFFVILNKHILIVLVLINYNNPVLN